jgi:hypothetical protein
MTLLSSEQDHEQRWRDWQTHNAEANRKSAIHARIMFAVILTAVGARLVMQLMAA